MVKVCPKESVGDSLTEILDTKYTSGLSAGLILWPYWLVEARNLLPEAVDQTESARKLTSERLQGGGTGEENLVAKD